MDLTPAQKRKLTKQRQQEKKAQSKEAYHSKRALNTNVSEGLITLRMQHR